MGRPTIIAADGQRLTEDELLARAFRVLGDASRLRVLQILARDGEMTQSQLVSTLGLTQSRASEHLACLAWCGFVTASRRGRGVIYTIARFEVLSLIEDARRFMAQHKSALTSCATLDSESRHPAATS